MKNYYMYGGLLIAGLALILLSARVEGLLSKIFFGLGITICATGIIYIFVALMGRKASKQSQSRHVEIFAKRRGSSSKTYTNENTKIQDKLQLLAFNAEEALNELRDQGELYEAFKKREAKIQILIVNPGCEAAKLRGRADSRSEPKKGLQVIFDKFQMCDGLFKTLCSNLAGHATRGVLELRITNEDPAVTIYNRDGETLIFGHYFGGGRGDKNASLKLTRSWHKEIYEQYKDHFDRLWFEAKDDWLFVLGGKKDPEWNSDLYNTILLKRPNKNPNRTAVLSNSS